MTHERIQTRPANWQPVLISLIRADQKFYAVKLLATAFGYKRRENRPDFARAVQHLEEICCLRKPLPDGTECADIDEVILAYYRHAART